MSHGFGHSYSAITCDARGCGSRLRLDPPQGEHHALNTAIEAGWSVVEGRQFCPTHAQIPGAVAIACDPPPSDLPCQQDERNQP